MRSSWADDLGWVFPAAHSDLVRRVALITVLVLAVVGVAGYFGTRGPTTPAPGPASPGVVLFVPGGRLVSKDGPLPAGPIEFWVLFPGESAPRMVGRITAQWLARLQRAFPDHPCGSHANPCVVPPS
jgi:hypothetical protein